MVGPSLRIRETTMAQGPGSISIMENFGRLVNSTSLFGMVAVLCVVTGGSLLSRAACAQGADTAVAFDIPAQPLGTALNSLAVQANLQIFFEQRPVDGLPAPAINGTMTP